MSNEFTPYILSRTLQSDLAPVRSLCHLESSNVLLAGSQAALLTRYTLGTSSSIAMDTLQEGHSHSITALLAGPSHSNDTDTDTDTNVDAELYVTGCKDGIVRVFRGRELVRELKGHTNNVSSLSWVYSDVQHHQQQQLPLLLSGSWDGIARIWNIETGECVQVLPDHENTTVVLGLKSGRIVTGSAGIAQNNRIVDTKIRIWQLNASKIQYELVKTIPYPTGPIRNLCSIPVSSQYNNISMQDNDNDSCMFATCSNDGTVKVWNEDSGECRFTFTHPESPMILSVMAGPDGTVVSTTEEGDLAVWCYESSEQPLQIIPHASTLWCAALLNDGEIATACQDGSVRIFSRDVSKACSEEELRTFEEGGKRGSKGPSSEEIAKLPRWEMRQVVAGKSEGQVQMFQKDGGSKAIAAQWSQTSGTWIEVGEVLSTRDTSTSGTINGVSYDYVFPIEFEASGGVQTLQIGYNNGDNPFVAAQTFIDQHELPQYHLQQIADYIMSRVGQKPVELGGMESGEASAPTTTPTPSLPVSRSYEHLPMKYAVVFSTELTNIDKIVSKVTSLNDEVEESAQLSAEDIDSLKSTLQTLANTSRYHSSRISNSEMNVLLHTLQNWHCSRVFPIVDVLRVCILHPDAASSSRWNYWNLVIEAVIKKCNEAALDKSKGSSALIMLSMRLFANAFKQSGSNRAASECSMDIVECVKHHASTENKNVRLAIATVLMNMSSSLASDESVTGTEQLFQELIGLLRTIFLSKSYVESQEGLTRSLLALGTIIHILRKKKHFNGAPELLTIILEIKGGIGVDATKTASIISEVCDILAN